MKKFLLVILLICTSVLIWFFFIKKYDYQFRFKTQAGMPTSFQHILNLEEIKYDEKVYSLKNVEQDSYTSVTQQFTTNSDQTILVNWDLESVTDSLTQVKVNFLQRKNTFLNRLGILNPFSKSKYVNQLQSSVRDVSKLIEERGSSFSIHFKGEETSPAIDCACISTGSTVENKAFAMVATVNTLMDFITANELELQGNPLLKVRSWDMEKNYIRFDFCFPITITNTLQQTGEIELKRIESQHSLFAVFKGNYRDSHIAWLEVLEKAKRNNMKVTPLPLEVYYNNPMMGGDAIDWRADVYLPLN